METKKKTERNSNNNLSKKQKQDPNLMKEADAALLQKIDQFIKEVGDKTLSHEQAKVYAAFTKTSGSNTYLNITDKDGNTLRLKIISNSETSGTRYILRNHYKTRIHYVTANEILNLSKIIESGERYPSYGYTVYKLEKTSPQGLIREVLRIAKDGKTAVLKSFYSDREPIQTKKHSRPAFSSPRRGRHRNSGRGAKSEMHGKNTKKSNQNKKNMTKKK